MPKKNFHFTPTTWLLIGILVIASFLRLWNLPQTLQFLGDQGRDAIIVSRIFKEFDPVFIGPVTSVGNMYLGPLYYYFMAPFLWLSYPSPLGPVYAVAILSILTTWLVYYLGKELIGRQAALWATFFYATSATVVEFARFSWNPNPAPLFSLLMMYSSYKAWQGKYWYWVGVAISFSVLIQLHYLTILAAPAAGVIWLYQWYTLLKPLNAPALKSFWLASLLGLVIFIWSLAPLMAFDSRHEWLNAKAFGNMLTSKENFKNGQDASPLDTFTKALKETHGRSMHILAEISLGQQRQVNTLLVIGLLGLLVWQLMNRDEEFHWSGKAVLACYLFFGILGTSFYEHTVFDHYIAYLFPVTFLLYGLACRWLWDKGYLGRTATIIFTLSFLVYNFSHYPLQKLGWTIHDIKRTSQTITDRVKPGEKYDVVLLSETKDIDAQNYRYYLTTTDMPPIKIEELGDIDTLFIIDEEKKGAKVTDLPIYIIVVFPNKEPAEVYNVPGGPQITVLRRK